MIINTDHLDGNMYNFHTTKKNRPDPSINGMWNFSVKTGYTYKIS